MNLFAATQRCSTLPCLRSGQWLMRFVRKLRHPIAVAAMVFAGDQHSAEIRAADLIVRHSDGVSLRGEFTEMTPESVTIKTTGGKTEQISVSNIRNLQFDQEPATLAQARTNERSGALDLALQKYEQVRAEGSIRDKQLAEDLDFLIARTRVKLAIADPSGRDTALKAISEFRAAHRTGFRILEATLLEASLRGTKEDRPAAEKLLQEVRDSPVRGFQLQAGVQLGRLQLQAGDPAAAMTTFDQVVQQSNGDADALAVHFDGMLGKALCLQQQVKLDESLLALDQVLEKASEVDTRVLAEAWIHKGDCLLLKNEPKSALMAFLHVDVLYPSEPAEHAQALFHLARLWGPAGHPDRAADAAARLTEKYPNSQWASQNR
jgi:tetratricopeptide (TPR) repeat protein